MIELLAVKKHRVSLLDYDYRRDIECRLLLSCLTTLEQAVLEEILYSPIRTSLCRIAKSIDVPEDETLVLLQKFAKVGLIAIEDDAVVVDKEARKYFEVEAEKFDEDFLPGMEFLQHLLKKVPIHILPQWYAIPRTSDNIFESIVEKYLLTPQIFQRYLLDLNFQDPTLPAIAQDVLKSPHFEVSAKDIQKKYNLSSEQFQEAILHLEFHFVCTTVYRKDGNHWKEIVTLFQEWKDYLLFLKETTPTSIDPKQVQRYRPFDFSFVDDIASLLKKEPIQASDSYLKQLQSKIEEIDLMRPEARIEWIAMCSEDRAVYIYRHPISLSLIQEKVLREIEKSLCRILPLGWIRFTDFLKGVHASLRDGQAVTLRKTGKTWKYQLPTYTPEEIERIQTALFHHLFEAGITALGTADEEPCFCVTLFGQSLLG